jgi:hypothetical protein
MKYSAILLLLSAAACGSPPSSARAHPLFAGAWTGTQTTTLLCGSSSTSSAAPWAATFSELPEGVRFTSTPDVAGVQASCTFDFSVAGDVASLEGAPFVCAAGANLVTYTAISLTSDGAHLAGVVTATVTTADVQTCTLSQAIEAAR